MSWLRAIRQVTYARAVGFVVALPALVDAKRRLRRQADMDELVRAVGSAKNARLGAAVDSDDLDWGLRGALLVLGPRSAACVPRGLAMYSMLTRRKRPAAFVSGVARPRGELVGHAWVVTPERAYDEDPAGGFELTYRFENRWWRAED